MINKIDLPNADVPSVHRQLEEILAIPAEEAIDASAKMGIGIEEILEAIVDRTTFIAMTAVLGIVLGVLLGV